MEKETNPEGDHQDSENQQDYASDEAPWTWPVQQCHPSKKASNCNYYPTKQPLCDWSQFRAYEKWSAVLTVIGLIVGTIVAGIYFCQLRAMQDAVTATRESVEVSQRAWLIARKFAVLSQPPTREAREIAVPIVVENSGKTPATFVQGRAVVDCAVAIPAELDWSQLKQSWTPQALTIGPGQPRALFGFFNLRPECKMSDVIDKKTILFAYGYWNYWDEFKTPRGLIFCGRYIPEAHTFEFCEQNNLPW